MRGGRHRDLQLMHMCGDPGDLRGLPQVKALEATGREHQTWVALGFCRLRGHLQNCEYRDIWTASRTHGVMPLDCCLASPGPVGVGQ